ncbi:6-phosphofructokinase [Egicoccus sp. AB-alg6-2]|uniref:6-phosphofructokinase n=1 Tax=Egicoccus sp. AB-alg6-2 TaxID=3242692 RepID=UPI00359EF5C1
MVSRIGILTGGGDCPGLNAAIRAVVRRADQANVLAFGFRAGWKGVLDLEVDQLTLATTRGLLHRGGTILGTSRVDPYREHDGVARIAEALEVHRLDGLVVIGGEGTLSAAARLAKEGIPILGIPKTIDNDVAATELTIGFLTAVRTATEAVDRLHSTAESHNRVMVLEVMGRHAGWIATYAGMAGGADAILVPEVPFDIAAVGRHLKHRAGSGRDFSIVVVAEGALPREGSMEIEEPPKDEFGRPRLGGIGHAIAHEIEARTGFPARVTILGHVQRGGSPTPMDRVLATQMGVKAAELAIDGQWGAMTAFQNHEIVPVPLTEATAHLKTVPASLYRVAETFFG